MPERTQSRPTGSIGRQTPFVADQRRWPFIRSCLSLEFVHHAFSADYELHSSQKPIQNVLMGTTFWIEVESYQGCRHGNQVNRFSAESVVYRRRTTFGSPFRVSVG